MAVEPQIVKGGCFCGNIKFQFIPGDYLVANCHCEMCRKTSGAPFVTWVVVPKTNFKYTQGQPKSLNSSEKGTREFCGDCGTPMIFYSTDRPHDFDITTGCLENPNNFIPTLTVHKESKLHWLKDNQYLQKS